MDLSTKSQDSNLVLMDLDLFFLQGKNEFKGSNLFFHGTDREG